MFLPVAEQPSDPAALTDDVATYLRRIRAEINAETQLRRLQDPEIARQEAEIERAWAAVAPPGATGPTDTMLLHRTEQVAMIDVHVPTEGRPGVRHVKRLIRKLSFWYFSYVVGQINTFHNVVGRYLRSLQERIEGLEEVMSTGDRTSLMGPIAEPGPPTVSVLTDVVAGPHRVAVLSCGSGELVDALNAGGCSVYGVDGDANRILPGVSRGLDLRSDDPVSHLMSLSPGSVDAVVLQGFIEVLSPERIQHLLLLLKERMTQSGVVAVAATDPAQRTSIERDLLAGRGAAPATWAYLIERMGGRVTMVPVSGDRVPEVIVARFD